MSRRLSMLVAALLIVSLSGCVIVPEHRHCCWRYYGATDAPHQHRQRLAQHRKPVAPGLDLGAQFANEVRYGMDAVQPLGGCMVSSGKSAGAQIAGKKNPK